MNSISNFFNSGGPNLPNPQNQGFFGNFANFVQQFRQFASNPIGAIMSMKNVNVPRNFDGTPQQLANYLMSSGQMTQSQFSQFAQTANSLQNMLPKL